MIKEGRIACIPEELKKKQFIRAAEVELLDCLFRIYKLQVQAPYRSYNVVT